MKKFLMVSMLLVLGVSVAFGSSMKVPWFVDWDTANMNNPPNAGTTVGIITVTSNSDETVTAAIEYYNRFGLRMNVSQPANRPNATAIAALPSTDPNVNTFIIAPKASILFRPVGDDDPTASPRIEGGAGNNVPNRGSTYYGTTDVDDGTMLNGSAVISWAGESTLLQGAYQMTKNLGGSIVAWGHLLPAGS